MTVLILGSALDDEPAALVKHWCEWGRDAVLVQPRDLSQPGWRLRVGRVGEQAAAADGRRFGIEDVDAVICALPWIAPYELVHVQERDREYVAQEMGSFLLAWLHQFPGPVIDRPTPLGLAGCGRSRRQWAAVARSVGVDADPAWSGPTCAVTVVDGEPISCCFSDSPPGLADAAHVIATEADRTLVTLNFAASDGLLLVGAEERPAVGDAPIARRLLDLVERT
jgi:hypothetical protein